jgi:hypothetical protein
MCDTQDMAGDSSARIHSYIFSLPPSLPPSLSLTYSARMRPHAAAHNGFMRSCQETINAKHSFCQNIWSWLLWSL